MTQDTIALRAVLEKSSDATVARKQWRQVADHARPRAAKLAALMDDAEADVLAYMSFPG